MFRPKLFELFHKNTRITYVKEQLVKDIMAGIIVAVVSLPLSLALAIASGVTPEIGIITAIIAGFCISFFGGSDVTIGGPTGAFVVIVYGIVLNFGIDGLIIATMMAGLILILLGVLKLGSMIKFFPFPITVGFTSGIAVVLVSTQIKDFFGFNLQNVPTEFIDKMGLYLLNFRAINLSTVLIGSVSLIILFVWPKISRKVPSSIVAIFVSTLLVYFLHMHVSTIGSVFGEISARIPTISFHFPDVATIKKLFMPAVTIALLAAIESLLCAVVADGMIGKRHDPNTELIAQGMGNVFSALFGGIPATGAIARTAANVKNGGRTPVAGIVNILLLLLIYFLFMPYASMIPMCTLAAILIYVAYNMGEWKTFYNILKSTKSDAFILIMTFLLTVLFDLVVAIEIGMIIAAFLFMKKMSDVTQFKSIDITEESSVYSFNKSENIFVYEIDGPLFFGATSTFLDMMDEIKKDWDIIVLRMRNVPVIDASAFDVLKRMQKKCRRNHILLMFCEVNEQPMKLFENTSFVDEVGQYRFFDTLELALKEADGILKIKKSVHHKRNKHKDEHHTEGV